MPAYLHFEVHGPSLPVVDADEAVFAAAQEQGAIAGLREGARGLRGHRALHHLPQVAVRRRVHNVFIHQQIVAHLCTPMVAQVWQF